MMDRRTFVGAGAAGFASLAWGIPDGEMSAAQFHAARQFVHTRFGRIAYMEQGHGRAALFLHGFPLNSFQWRGVIGSLSAHRRCIAPDFMALGYTDVGVGQDVSPSAQVEMLAALLDKLRAGPVDLVANDSGSAVAQLFMARYPERVRTALLTNGDSEIDCPPQAIRTVVQLAREGRFADEMLGALVKDKPRARTADSLGGSCFADPANPSDAAIDVYLAPMVSSRRRKDLVHAFALGLAPNVLAGVEAALRRSQVPTRIVWGDADSIFSIATPAYLNSVLGQSRGVRLIAGSKLFWPEERPEIIVAEACALWAAA
jgi:haloalkane dehalogenase